jgi:hypothetical protein
MATDETWKAYFEVRARWLEDGDNGSRHVFDVVNSSNGSLVGTYNEESYARKQARRKYKKLVKLMEKSFMSFA